MNKSMVWTEVARDCLSIFRGHVAPACHNATDFPRWFKVGEPGQEGLPDGAYAVEYQVGLQQGQMQVKGWGGQQGPGGLQGVAAFSSKHG